MSYKRIVAKFGTSLLTGNSDYLDRAIMAGLVEQVAGLHAGGKEIIIVTSGAVAAGRQRLGLTKKQSKEREKTTVHFKQVLAAVGQARLMQAWDELFTVYGLTVAQALLTKQDLADRAGYLNARTTLLTLLEMRTIGIINENDVVAVDELEGQKFGDNDNLSATVANLVDADLLVLLTNIDGLYTADPRQDPTAHLIPFVDKIDEKLEKQAGGTADGLGTGGMATKLGAARLAMGSGITMVVANGLKPDILTRVVKGETEGTTFLPQVSKLESKKRWLLCGFSCKGSLKVDKGALAALRDGNRSLLPAGVTEVTGQFERGDVVDIVDAAGRHLANGIANYSSADIERIRGARSERIPAILGHDYGDEVIHRNNLVLS
jgi:glutamate 5-kinase